MYHLTHKPWSRLLCIGIRTLARFQHQWRKKRHRQSSRWSAARAFQGRYSFRPTHKAVHNGVTVLYIHLFNVSGYIDI